MAEPEPTRSVEMNGVDDQNGVQGAIVAVQPESMRLDDGTPVWVKVPLRTQSTLNFHFINYV